MTNHIEELEAKAAGYLKIIITNELASQRKVNPCDINQAEVEEMYAARQMPKYNIHQEVIKGYVNGKETHSVVCALIDPETGYWYCSESIR